MLRPIPLASSAGPVALLVLGVGRSGTSALARMLNLLGAALPHEVLGPGHGNDHGHWEPLRLMQINEAILNQHGRDWWDPRPIPRDWFAGADAASWARAIAACIAQQYGHVPLIVLKEPRCCRLVPLYLAALKEAGYAARAVLPVRDPREVMLSINRRDGTALAAAESIWLNDLLSAEAATRAMPRAWTTYDALLADWRGVAARIAPLLDQPWPVPSAAAAPAIGALLRRDLRHFGGGAGLPPAGPHAAALWKAARLADEASLQRGFDQVRAALAAQPDMAAADLGGLLQLLQQARAQCAALTGQVARIGAEIERLSRRAGAA